MRKVVVYAPSEYGEKIRAAIAEAGEGRIGNFTHVTLTTKNSDPHVSVAGEQAEKLDVMDEEKIEFACDDATYDKVVEAIHAVHPSADPVIESWDLGA